MKINRLFRYGIAAAAIGSFALATPRARAQEVTATFTNSFGNGVWEHDAHIGVIGNPNDPSILGNWSTLAYPDNHHHITDPNTNTNLPNNDPLYDAVVAINGCSLGASVSVQTVNVANGITLDIVPNGDLRIAGAGGITNDGTILVNPNAASTPAGIQFIADSQLKGTGSVTLNGIHSFDANYPSFADAYIYNGGNSTGDGKTITHGANHLIHGRGDLDSADNAAVFINNGTINADVNGSVLRVYFSLQAGNKNNATIEATNGGTLWFENGFVDQSGGGVLSAANNSLIQLGGISIGRALSVAGGTFTTTGTGVVEASDLVIDGCTNSGAMELLPGDYAQVKANGLTNNGTILVNTTAAHTPTGIQFVANAQLGGTGSIALNGINSFDTNYPSPADAYIYNGGNSTGDGKTITHGANHAIHGRGDLDSADNAAVFVNNGTINADVNGSLLRVYFSAQGGNQNNATIEATNGGTLWFEGGFVDQSGGGSLSAANNSLTQLGNLSLNRVLNVNGGSFTTTGTGVIDAGFLTVNGCTNSGAMELLPGDHLEIKANGLTNNGSILVNTTATNTATGIQVQVNTEVTGTGSIKLNGLHSFDDNYPGLPDAYIYSGNGNSGSGVPFTNGTGHLIHGQGDILFITGGAVLVNNGTFNADVAGGGKLRLDLTNDAGNQNNAMMKATNGGLMGMYGGAIDQTGGGTFLADGSSSIVLLTGDDHNNFARITGGTLNTANAGIIQGPGAILAGAVTNSGAYEIPANGSTLLYASTLTNNGTMTVDDSTALLRFDQNNTALGGTGFIALTNGAIMRVSGGQSVINGSNHTLKGNGTLDIQGTLTNNGIIAPGLSPGQLNFDGDLELGSTSNLSFEIGGTNQGTQYDWLNKTDGGTLTLNGSLTVRLINGFTPASSGTFTILTTQTTLAGAFTNVASGARLNTADGGGSFQVDYNVVNNAVLSRNVTLSDFQASTSPTPSPTPGGTRVDGQGTIAVPGGQASFAFHVKELKKNKFKSYLDYNDPFNGLTFGSLKITTLNISGNHAEFVGIKKFRGKRVTFTVDITDNGDPGTNDIFSITANNNTYSAGGNLLSGNILLH